MSTEATTTLVALLDGSLVDPSLPILRADDLGVLRGDGVFDVVFARRGTAPALEQHLDRLVRSASALDLPVPDLGGFRLASASLLQAWNFAEHPEALIRLVLLRGPDGGETTAYGLMQPVSTDAIRERTEGVAITLLERVDETEAAGAAAWMRSGAKSMSYAVSMAAKRYAKEHGFDDVVFVSPTGRLMDGPTSTLLVDRGGMFVTPRQDGLLQSLTLERVVAAAPGAGLSVEFDRLTPSDLLVSDGAWLISSGRVLAAVTAVDDTQLPRSPLDAALRRILGI